MSAQNQLQRNDEKYIIHTRLRSGGFGIVYKATQCSSGGKVALKMNKLQFCTLNKNVREISMLRQIYQLVSHSRGTLIQIIDIIDHDLTRPIMVFELLGASLFQVLCEKHIPLIPVYQIREIGYQLCFALQYLHDHNITHMDIKPANILFVYNPETDQYHNNYNGLTTTRIKIIDFGGGLVGRRYRGPFAITTLVYRAPEWILDLEMSHSYDIWSLGCIMFEMYTNRNFLVHEIWEGDLRHIAKMERILGYIPDSVINSSSVGYQYAYRSEDMQAERENLALQILPLPVTLHYYSNVRSYRETHSQEDYFLLLSLLTQLLTYCPKHRSTARHASHHDFFLRLRPSFYERYRQW